MGSALQPGLRQSARVEVSRDRTFDLLGEITRVYATPMLVHDMRLAGKAARAGRS